MESLSSYARQFLGQMERPEVEKVTGVSPTLSIDQKTVNRNPRSTVGTVTEIYDHLRLWMARLGTPHCPECDSPIQSLSLDTIVDRILETATGKRVIVLGPIVRERKGEYRKELEGLHREGWVRARIDGEIRYLDQPIELARYEKHTIEVVVDRLKPSLEKRSRLAERLRRDWSLARARLDSLWTMNRWSSLRCEPARHIRSCPFQKWSLVYSHSMHHRDVVQRVMDWVVSVALKLANSRSECPLTRCCASV